MAGMYTVQVLWVRGIAVDMAVVVPLIIGLLLMVIGNYLGWTARSVRYTMYE